MTSEPDSTAPRRGVVLCPACRAGGLISFSWPDPPNYDDDKHWRPMESLQADRPLRYGTLYRCLACARPWHLNGAGNRMTIVPEGRLELVLAWNAAEIMLPDAVLEALGEIGPTPPDIYGNRRDYVEIPCGVLTRSGERVDVAIVSIQQDAPVDEWRPSRLGSEIASVYPSPLALPLEVRLACTEAPERAMGFAPTLIEMPDGKRFTLNGTPDFLNVPGYRAADARTRGYPDQIQNLPDLPETPQRIYFIADG